MAVNGGVVLCLRKGIRFQRYVKSKAKCEANFGGGEKRIRFRGPSTLLRVNFVEGMEAVVLASKGCATPLLDARLRGQDGGGGGRFFVLRGEQAGAQCHNGCMLAVMMADGKVGNDTAMNEGSAPVHKLAQISRMRSNNRNGGCFNQSRKGW